MLLKRQTTPVIVQINDWVDPNLAIARRKSQFEADTFYELFG